MCPGDHVKIMMKHLAFIFLLLISCTDNEEILGTWEQQLPDGPVIQWTITPHTITETETGLGTVWVRDYDFIASDLFYFTDEDPNDVRYKVEFPTPDSMYLYLLFPLRKQEHGPNKFKRIN